MFIRFDKIHELDRSFNKNKKNTRDEVIKIINLIATSLTTDNVKRVDTVLLPTLGYKCQAGTVFGCDTCGYARGSVWVRHTKRFNN